MRVLAVVILSCFLVVSGDAVRAGSKEPVASDDPEVEFVAKWAASRLHGQLVAVVKAQKQVVAGIMYYIEMKVNVTEQMKYCDIKVWVRWWLNSKKLLRTDCRRITS